ncbi:MAG: ribosome silencing factor [Gammaproteobacteria bacterium]|nr:ribosome silencing factor [Gammaproteobacteria bacterium]
MQGKALAEFVITALEDIKGQEIRLLDVGNMTAITDYMVIASGSSNRHVKALANNVLEKTKAASIAPLGVEGQQDAEWILIDLQDVLVHIMQPRVRDFYNLEKLWDADLADSTPPAVIN